MHAPAVQAFPPVHAATAPQLQILLAASQESVVVLPSQVAAVPHLQTPPEHTSPVTAHVTSAHGSRKIIKFYFMHNQINFWAI